MHTEELMDRYNAAWNDHALDAIVAMHADGMVFENHTAGERAEGDTVRDHIARIFDAWPDIHFEPRRMLIRGDVVVNEWTATATHTKPLRRGDLTAEPTGNELSWRGVDIFTLTDEPKIARKDVYSDSVSILRGAGLLD